MYGRFTETKPMVLLWCSQKGPVWRWWHCCWCQWRGWYMTKRRRLCWGHWIWRTWGTSWVSQTTYKKNRSKWASVRHNKWHNIRHHWFTTKWYTRHTFFCKLALNQNTEHCGKRKFNKCCITSFQKSASSCAINSSIWLKISFKWRDHLIVILLLFQMDQTQ